MPPKRKERVYSKELMETVNKTDLKEEEKNAYNLMFNKIIEDTGLYKPADLMMLDVLCFDYIRIRRIQKMIATGGDTFKVTTKYGSYDKVREVSYLLNAINSSFRTSMKELMLSRKERTKKEIGKDSKDFANWLADNAIEVEVSDSGTSEDKSKKGQAA